MSLLSKLFDGDFWVHEAVALRDSGIEILQVLAFYLIGRFLIVKLSKQVARGLIAGQRRLGVDPGSEARLKTVIGMIRSVGLYALCFVSAILFLRAINIDAITVVESASVVGLAFGFGAQKLVRDVISGFFIITENQYSIGDYVTINGTVSGRVEEMGMRIVKLRDDTGKLYIFANGDITQVCNQSRGAISSVVDLGVPPATDVAKVRELVDAAGAELFDGRKELGLMKPPALLGVSGGDSLRTIIRAIVQVEDPIQLGAATVALRDAVYAKLLAAGITPMG